MTESTYELDRNPKTSSWLSGCTFDSLRTDPFGRDEPTVYYKGAHGLAYVWLRWLSPEDLAVIGAPSDIEAQAAALREDPDAGCARNAAAMHSLTRF